MAKEKILAVDDEEDIRELISFNLEKDGYTVETAESGEKSHGDGVFLFTGSYYP